jgi:hypothetical protein
VRVSRRHPEPLDRLAFEVELDEHDRFLADHPAIVAGIDGDNLRRLVLDDTTIRIFNMNLAARQEADMRVHAAISADNRLHVDRPAESGRIDHPFHACRAGPADLELDMTDVAPFSTLHRCEQWINAVR